MKNNMASELKEALLSRENAVIENFLNEKVSDTDTKESIEAKIDKTLATYSEEDMKETLEGLNMIATKQELEDGPELD